MDFIKRFSHFHLDVLKEIGNIGAGHAATALSTLLNKKVDMRVPNVRIVSFDEMVELAGGAESTVACVFLQIEGDISGNMFFVLSVEQANHFIQRIMGDEHFSFNNPPYNELGLSALQEMGNILAGSYLSSLSDFTNLELYPSVPAISIDMVGAIISFGLIELSQVSDYCIVIDTAFNDDADNEGKSINGHFFLLPNPDSFDKLFHALGVTSNE